MNSKNNTRLFRNYPVTHDFLNDPDFAEFLARAEANDHTPDTPTNPQSETHLETNSVGAQYIAPAPPAHSESQESTPSAAPEVGAQYIAPAPPLHFESQESTPEVGAQYIAPAPPSHSKTPESIPQQPIHSKWSVALDRPTRIPISPRMNLQPLPPIRGAPRPRKSHPIFQAHIDILIIFYPKRRFPNPLAG